MKQPKEIAGQKCERTECGISSRVRRNVYVAQGCRGHRALPDSTPPPLSNIVPESEGLPCRCLAPCLQRISPSALHSGRGRQSCHDAVRSSSSPIFTGGRLGVHLTLALLAATSVAFPYHTIGTTYEELVFFKSPLKLPVAATTATGTVTTTCSDSFPVKLYVQLLLYLSLIKRFLCCVIVQSCYPSS
jgi:hypothetical protein